MDDKPSRPQPIILFDGRTMPKLDFSYRIICFRSHEPPILVSHAEFLWIRSVTVVEGLVSAISLTRRLFSCDLPEGKYIVETIASVSNAEE